jgi:3-deoxy-7-phosphoheptulonate synthase
MLLIVETPEHANDLAAHLEREGHEARAYPRSTPPLVDVRDALPGAERLPGVQRVIHERTPLLSVRGLHAERRVVQVGPIAFGGRDVPVIAGPCSLDVPERLDRVSASVREAGAVMLRAGITKARTSPFGFQGRGVGALPVLAAAARRHGLPVVSEVLTIEDIPAFAEHVDMLQVGARNMHNMPLLRALGRCGRPVLLKRGFGSTIDELLHAADAVLAEGNEDVVLCERGIRTFEGGVRFSFDLSALTLLLERTRLPVVVDPSHAAGRASLVPGIARAAIAAGADGLLIEVHDRPAEALSDKEQALDLPSFAKLMTQLRAVSAAVERGLHAPVAGEGAR